MRPKASSSVVEYPILIAYPSMYGMLKVCSVNDLHFRISSARVKSSFVTGIQAFFTSGRYRKVWFLDVDWFARQHYNQIPVSNFFKSRLSLCK